MRKITFLLLFLTANIMLAQTWTTGQVTLDAGDNYSVQFDINVGTNTVTMTMIGNQNVWLAVGPGIATNSPSGGMGALDDDAIVFNSAGLQDRNMPSGTGTPPLDNAGSPIDEWTLVSNDLNTPSAGIRTVVATRAIDTGDSEDFVFPTSAQALPILWAHGNGTTTFGYHGFSNKGGVTANITLSTPEFESEIREFSIYPNPSSSTMNIGLPALVEGLKVEVYDILGKKVYSDNISTLSTSVDVSQWNSGMFLVKLSSVEDNVSLTKRFVKM
ncbi:T9SS type A sorting domain-containing protein [Pontimicrobium sp. MEBiC01747]